MSEERLAQLEKNEAYASYQAELAFEKELNILRNDFYYQMIDSRTISLVDFLYRPLDTLSGDAYSARRIDEHRTFYLLVDGMGKGVSASLTAVSFTAFVNHLVDKMIEHDSFSIHILVQEAVGFIQSILLEDEVLSADFIFFNSYFGELEYAKFSMPPFLLQDFDDKVTKIKSNNPPISKWSSDFIIDMVDVKRVDKFLFYSDGIVENGLKDEPATYAKYIVEDFRSSFTKEEFREKFFNRIEKQEDDFSIIFLNSLDLREKTLIAKENFTSKLDTLEHANSWYEALWNSLNVDVKLSHKAEVVFTELMMNAYEHGNLAIDAHQKHIFLEDDTYIDKLLELESKCNKMIAVEVYRVCEMESEYIITKICDEGEGFDTQILAKIFRNSKKFNGRGVFVSRKNSMGIYYNSKGNCVLFLIKI
jgi:hypothetical protein